MALNNVNISIEQGGLNRSLPNEDHVAAILFDQSAPASWGSDKAKRFRSIAQVEQAGILATDPLLGLVHYTASEFFRMSGGELYIVFNINTTEDFLAATAGRVRMIASYGVLGDVSAWQGICQELAAANAPAVFIGGLTTATDVFDSSELIDLHNMGSSYVSVVIAGDGSGQGAALATSLGLNCIPNVGAVLGALSSAQVHISAAWVERFNFNTEGEMASIKLADGSNLDDALISDLDDLNDRGYLFFRRFPGLSGYYLNDTFSAVDLASDYAYIENNRVVQKAYRLLYATYVPKLNSPIQVDANTGKLSPEIVKYFEALGDKALREKMTAEGELSGHKVEIDPDQNILSNSKLEINVKLVPVGVARNIDISLGFAVSL